MKKLKAKEKALKTKHRHESMKVGKKRKRPSGVLGKKKRRAKDGRSKIASSKSDGSISEDLQQKMTQSGRVVKEKCIFDL